MFVAYVVKWLKARLDRRPPREHKPTKEERIAELEARVEALEAQSGAEITRYTFTADLAAMTNVRATGVWNTAQARLEF